MRIRCSPAQAMEISPIGGRKPAATDRRGYGLASLLARPAEKPTPVFRGSKAAKSQHAQRLASDRRRFARCPVAPSGRWRLSVPGLLTGSTRGRQTERKAGERRSCQPAESGHSLLPLIVIAGKASTNGEARQGGRHDHEHWQAARSALEDGDRFRSGGLGAGVGPAFAADKIIVGLITKENTNPFSVKSEGRPGS